MAEKKFNEKADFDELQKSETEFSVVSEDKKSYIGIINWNVPKVDIENLCTGKNQKSSMFSIGSPTYCYFQFMLYPCGNYISFCILFKNKLPESARVEGKISIEGLISSKTFSACGSDVNKQCLDLDTLAETGAFLKFDNVTDPELIIHCAIKIELKDVQCTIDKYKVQYIESRNNDSYEDLPINLDFISDVTLKVDDIELKSYKAVLAKIPIFQQLFDKDESNGYFEVTNISLPVLKIVLNYLYTEAIPLMDFVLACEIYISASDLQMFDLKNMCSSYLGANLTEENVFIVTSLSDEWNDISLKKECIKFIKASNIEQLAEKSVIL